MALRFPFSMSIQASRRVLGAKYHDTIAITGVAKGNGSLMRGLVDAG